MPRARGNQSFNLLNGLNAAAGADGSAIQRSGGAGKLELFLEWAAAKHGENKSCVKNVARTRGVGGLHLKSGRVVELRSIPSEHALLAQGSGGETVAKASLNRRQRFLQIFVSRQFAGDIAAGNQIIDMGQEGLHTRVEFVQVRDHRNARGARPRRGLCRRCRVMTVNVKGTGIDDPIAIEFLGTQFQTIIALPEDRAFAKIVHKNKRLLAVTVRNGKEMRFHAGACKFSAMDGGGMVVADLADVPCAQSPLLASDNGAGDLSSGQDHGRANFNLGAALGEMCDGNQRVRGVEPYTNEIDFRNP